MRRVCLIAIAVLIVAAGVCGIVLWVNETEWQRGKWRAENDWKSGEAVLFTKGGSLYCEHGVYFEQKYDRETGLPLRSIHYDRNTRFYDGYNATISQLLKSDGVPPWSARDYIPTDKEIAAALESPDLKRVTTFPAEVSDSIVIVNGGVFSRWGRTSSGPGVSIEARRFGTIAVGKANEAVLVGRSRTYPQVVLVRMGNRWLGVFHEDGRFISSAYVPE